MLTLVQLLLYHHCVRFFNGPSCFIIQTSSPVILCLVSRKFLNFFLHNLIKSTVSFYLHHESPKFGSFFETSKAFNLVTHHAFFKHLLENNFLWFCFKYCDLVQRLIDVSVMGPDIIKRVSCFWWCEARWCVISYSIHSVHCTQTSMICWLPSRE